MDEQNLDPNLTDEMKTEAAAESHAESRDGSSDAANSAETLAPEQKGEISLTEQLERAEALAEEYLDSLQRERASFLNYKRRVERERAEQSRVMTGAVLIKLLPVLDDFYRAMDAVPAEAHGDWIEGVTLILRKLERFLADEGVTEIEALGQPFDPNLHEAVGVDEESQAEHGTITEVVRRGYKMGDRVLRPAMVRVAG